MKKDLPKVLIFNAPPSSGKDISAEYCCQFVPSVHLQFKKPLLEMCCKILNMNYESFLSYYVTSKDIKDLIRIAQIVNVIGEQKHYSIREFMIHISENVIKPVFGSDFFGAYAKKNLVPDKWNIFSDGGFKEEILALTDCNIIIVKIQRDGCSFKDDSRGWIDDSLVGKTIYMENNGTIEEFYKQLDVLIERELR